MAGSHERINQFSVEREDKMVLVLPLTEFRATMSGRYPNF